MNDELDYKVRVLVTDVGATLTGSRAMYMRLEAQKFMNKLQGLSQRFRYADKIKINKRTDWDYAVADTKENRAILRKAIFMTSGEFGGYGDTLTNTVFYSNKYPHVQFILKNDMALFHRVWDNMDIEFYARFIWKRSRLYSNLTNAETRNSVTMVCDMLYSNHTQIELDEDVEYF